ncbi:hypothetical protein BX600DRAFT_432402 [Xylariales sp. PMI_506]|nr:hypothetical protein BX600DRAFT_432402 [Xylariales sp. PMI_506]
MRFASFLATGILALTASAQTATDSSGATGTTTSVVATDSAQAAIDACLNAFWSINTEPDRAGAAGDVNCQAHCITVPSPDSSAVNATTECVDNCPQGNGTATDNANYGDCVQSCIQEFYYSTSVGTPTNTGDSGSGNSAGSTVSPILSTVTSDGTTFTSTIGSTTVAATGTGTGTGTATGSSASSSSSSKNAADVVFRPGSSSLGLLGFLAAVLAL